MEIPKDLLFTIEHEWIRVDGNTAVIGISDFAQQQLGDIVFVEMPAVGSKLDFQKPFGVVESVKTVSDLFAPISGTVSAINNDLETTPELINSEPYGKGWIVKIDITDLKELETLLNPETYEEQCNKES